MWRTRVILTIGVKDDIVTLPTDKHSVTGNKTTGFRFWIETSVK